MNADCYSRFIFSVYSIHANWNWNLTFGSGSDMDIDFDVDFCTIGYTHFTGARTVCWHCGPCSALIQRRVLSASNRRSASGYASTYQLYHPCKQFTELESQSRQETTRALAETRELKAERDKSVRDVHTAQLEAQSWRQELAGCKAAVSIVQWLSLVDC